ncbi:DUF4126 domain-containing protein [Deinococcus detaillensis]|uniref:DUF4126 domain-containing protein n=1 Tax=Deinococcus detaillensis TaxID=2592048 RepID=A0A553V6I2_9DEIO|nr:DUF4126 domain-containing protein [Deinococcus detaillensis]TSA88069.1 DUF4126 domain-containing protein [Deinococcus detaillensis]
MEVLTGLLTSFGLSGAAGLNAYVPLLIVGLLQRYGVIALPESYALLSNTWVLLGITVVGALDFVGDKIPGIDHALHVFGGILNAAAGAVLFASHAGITHLDPSVSLLLGFVVAGSVQMGRTVLRPASTALTGGLANPLVSTAEDGTSVLLSILAIFAPVLAVTLLLLLLYFGFRLWQRRPRRRSLT